MNEYELQGFADASSKTISAVLYLRNRNGANTTVNLLTAKTKVNPIASIVKLDSKTKGNPIKFNVIPRLELNAAVILAELTAKQKSILNIYS